MIRSIRFCAGHWSRIRMLEDRRDYEMRFAPGYNVLVGPNGAGKTTVLEALAGCDFCEKNESPGHRVKYITTEALTPLSGMRFSTEEKMALGVRALFSSHGETVQDILAHQKYGGEDCILIDTPETGQDIDECRAVHRRLRRMCVKHGLQVILATHNILFLQEADRVIEFRGRYAGTLLRAHRRVLDRLQADPEGGRRRR